MNMPNVITILRILAVPLTIWLIISGDYRIAFWIFIAAGISDGVDGFIAKRFDQRTELGAYLDPAADKLLLVSIYITLALLKLVPAWLAILVASRDILIIGGVLLAAMLDHPVHVKPLMLSKINTTAQIILAGGILCALGYGFADSGIWFFGYLVVAGLTSVSGIMYLLGWVRLMTSSEEEKGASGGT